MPRKKSGDAAPPAPIAKSPASGKKPPAAAAKPPKKKAAGKTRLYLLKVQLKHICPPVWRTFFVPSDISLIGLNYVIQALMGWTDCHLHSFRIYGEICEVKTDPASECLDEEWYGLDSFGFRKRSKFIYIYDYGDWWEHELTVMDTDYRPKESGRRAGCLDGERASPPEDCGGIGGYENLLDILADPEHEEHEEKKEWAGEDYDPELFSAEEMDISLSKMRLV
ncbi:MAG: plasmid pRiA4b ORF-3 family protein [Deltaproteobacteria bacterium]|jgi:hypothetical protein|nr:plasmid pRiA4b ORF-3 family protein [Deltaproteobacteria bacterium]